MNRSNDRYGRDMGRRDDGRYYSPLRSGRRIRRAMWNGVSDPLTNYEKYYKKPTFSDLYEFCDGRSYNQRERKVNRVVRTDSRRNRSPEEGSSCTAGSEEPPRKLAPCPSERRREIDHYQIPESQHPYPSMSSLSHRFPNLQENRAILSPTSFVNIRMVRERDRQWNDAVGPFLPLANAVPSAMQRRNGLPGLIDIMDKIQEVSSVVGRRFLEMPKIVVVGDQSSGKSSVLENIVGKDFLPRGSGFVTRCPVVIRLFYDYKLNEDLGLFFHRADLVYSDFDDIRDELEADMKRIAGTGIGISDRPIVVDIFSRNVINLTLIDLPGIPPESVGDESKDLEMIIHRIIKTCISQPDSIILAVTAANTDPTKSKALQMAAEADPEGLRTLGVITKLDLLDKEEGAYTSLANKLIPLRLGYVGVINRSQKDIDTQKTMKQQWRDEDLFLHQNYRDIAEKNGTRYLREKVNSLLLQHIRSCLPSLMTYAIQFRIRRLKELEEMTYGPGTLPQLQIVFFRCVTAFTDEFIKWMNGYSYTKTKEMEGGTRVMNIFQNVFREHMKELEFVKELSEEELVSEVENQQRVRGGLFVPNESFKNLIRKGILTFCPYCEECIDLVRKELCAALRRIENPIFISSPVFKKRLFSIVYAIIEAQYQKTKTMIHLLLNMESCFIDMDDPDFIGSDMEQVREEVTTRVKKRLMELKSRDVLSLSIPVVKGWLYKRNKHNQYQRRFVQIQNRILTCAYNSSLSDLSSEPQTYRLDGAEARFLEKNKVTGEYEFEIVAEGCHLQFRVEQDRLTENWVNWVTACSNEKRFAYTLRQVVAIEEKGKNAERMLNDPVELEKRISVEMLKDVVTSYFNIVRRRLINGVPTTIMYMLVNKVKELILPRIVKELFNDAMLWEMLSEDERISKKREATRQKIVYFTKTMNSIFNIWASGYLNPMD